MTTRFRVPKLRWADKKLQVRSLGFCSSNVGEQPGLGSWCEFSLTGRKANSVFLICFLKQTKVPVQCKVLRQKEYTLGKGHVLDRGFLVLSLIVLNNYVLLK